MNVPALAVALLLSLVAPALAQPAAAGPAAVVVSLDGTSLGKIGLALDPARSAIEVAPLARALGWKVTPLAGGLRLQGDDRNVTLLIGSRFIREYGDAQPAFREAAFERNGKVFLATNDAVRFFDLRVGGGNLQLRRPEQLGTNVQIADVPRPAAPRARATPKVRRSTQEQGQGGDSRAGRILLSMDKTGALRFLRLSAQTTGGNVQTQLDSTGVNAFGAPAGMVTLGTKVRNTAVGLLTNPLDGLILRGGGTFEAVDVFRAQPRRHFFAGRLLQRGLTLVGTTVGDPVEGGADTFAILSGSNGYSQSLFRRFEVWKPAWGTFSREFIASDRGFGIGFGARSQGRTFLESTASIATRGLVQSEADAPISLDVGRHLSPATTVAGGFFATAQQALAPFLGISTRTSGFIGSLNVTRRAVTANLGYQTGILNASLYATPGLAGSSGFQGSLAFPGLSLLAQSQTSNGVRASSIEARTVRRGLNFIGGLSSTMGRVSPFEGISVPVGDTFALEASLRAVGGAPATLHVGISMGLRGRRPARAPTVAATIRVVGEGAGQAMRLFVDGAPVAKFAAATTTLQVEMGAHTFAVESMDGSTGSVATPVSIESAGDTVDLALWPERTLSGRVQVAPGVVAPVGFSLEGILVLVQPGNVTVETSADGTFVVPKQPISPDATIGVDGAALPRELRAPAPVPVAGASVTLTLESGLRIERQNFPAK